MDLELENYIPQRIIELCKKYKISRYQISQKTGISQSVLSDIVNKKNMPTLYTLQKICIAFEISLAQFFSEDGDLPDITQGQKEILELWINLAPEKQKFIETCLKSMIN